MRVGYILIAVVATLLTCFTSITTSEPLRFKEATSNRILSADDEENEGMGRRLVWLRRVDSDDLKAFPLTEVKLILAKESTRNQYLQSWGDGKVSIKNLAKGLKLSTAKSKRLRDILNWNKKDQLKVLKMYEDYLKTLKKIPSPPVA
ncbi:hypothetical protein GN244_ATG10615 [Phytophthora infestans]|uniref:RxLR effector protein n=1 Tax=Phytophthora infestans TaxID=4787 RepID=A0A833WU44_PHYIN|nr:hypothetical protein GN244_ATG10615 [Phytophthora infestans]KAF4142706.1 hypothetical protein GN958_ATG08098 [Phytophthora infestans]KAI9985861.1 hypothetical protein PInf_024641 [Phytophthora infestans]